MFYTLNLHNIIYQYLNKARKTRKKVVFPELKHSKIDLEVQRTRNSPLNNKQKDLYYKLW